MPSDAFRWQPLSPARVGPSRRQTYEVSAFFLIPLLATVWNTSVKWACL